MQEYRYCRAVLHINISSPHPATPPPPHPQKLFLSFLVGVLCGQLFTGFSANNNNILYSSQREIKAVVRSHNEEHISVIQSHETPAHIHTLRHTPLSLSLHTLIGMT